MDQTKEAETEGVNLYVTTLSDLYNCYNREKEYRAVVMYATKALKIKELPKFYYFRIIANENNNVLQRNILIEIRNHLFLDLIIKLKMKIIRMDYFLF